MKVSNRITDSVLGYYAGYVPENSITCNPNRYNNNNYRVVLCGITSCLLVNLASEESPILKINSHNTIINTVGFIQSDNSKEFQKMLTLDYFSKRKFKAKKNIKYSLSDEQLSSRLSDNTEKFPIYSYSEKDYKDLINFHYPLFSNGLEEWL